MGKTMEQLVKDKYGVKLDEIAFALMTGKYMVTEISQESDGRIISTDVKMIVEGQELNVKLSKRIGF